MHMRTNLCATCRRWLLGANQVQAGMLRASVVVTIMACWQRAALNSPVRRTAQAVVAMSTALTAAAHVLYILLSHHTGLAQGRLLGQYHCKDRSLGDQQFCLCLVVAVRNPSV